MIGDISSTVQNENEVECQKLKVACILDEFPYEWLRYECNLIQVTPSDWKQIVIKEKPDLLLVQSAWRGNKDSWKGKVIDLDSTKNSKLKNLVSWCRNNRIPTVFWNIEDPYHFKRFIECAKLFEYIFTTDQNSISKYNEILKHERIYSLPFAAQPKIHNPIGKDKEKLGDVAFAGSWYNNGHEDRKKDMEIILKPALKYNLHIYDRFYNYTKNNDFRYPEIYQPYIKGSLSYQELLIAHKQYNVFLNVNTVQNSPTMFACRVFELLACGINVISGYALGIEKMLPGLVKLCKTEEDTIRYLDILLRNKEIRDRLSLLGQREVFNKHTYRHRFETIINKVKIKCRISERQEVSVITCTNRPSYMENVFDNFERQSYENKELIIILNNNSMNLEEWNKKANNYKNIKVFQIDERKSLGECLNYGVDQAEFDYIAKFDDDNYYGAQFIGDLMNAFKYSEADIVGKYSYYSYLERSKVLALHIPNRENQYVNFLCGSAFIAKKTVFNKIKFINTTVDTVTVFFRECVNNQLVLYSADRFNFVYIRNLNNDNTWKIDDDEFLRKCNIISYTNDYIKHVTVD